jgi:DNA polymerase III epsilon subunit-like protein
MIIVDVETTGTDPRYHSLVSIGAIDFNNPTDTFFAECRIFEGAKIDKGALKVNGMTEAELEDTNKKTEAQILSDFILWMRDKSDHTVAGQNPFFDVSFLLAAAERAGANISLAHRIIDLHSIVYFHMIKNGITPPISNKRTDLNSDKIMTYVGIPAEPKPHIAFNGAKWEAEAFNRLIKGKNLFPEFAGYEIPFK